MGAAEQLHRFHVGPGLDGAALAAALGRRAEELAGFLIRDLRGLDAAAVYEAGTLRIDGVVPAGPAEIFRLDFRYAWTAQHGCSDWSCRDTEVESATFRYRGDEVIFTVPAAAEERTTREEF